MSPNNANMKIITGSLLFEGSIPKMRSKLLIGIPELCFSATYNSKLGVLVCLTVKTLRDSG